MSRRKTIHETAPLDDRVGQLALLVVDGGRAAMALDRTLRVGRDPSCELRVDDDSLSRVHFSISPGTPQMITDCGSKNGTFVGTHRLPPNVRTPIAAGSVIRAGNVMLLLDVMRVGNARSTASEDSALLSPIGLMESVLETAEKLAKDDITVLLSGETGVGKEVIARFLHTHSTRREGPFVPVHAAALSPLLFESVLFGHEKGSFTGATAEREGLFEQANGGTLFFDEVGELPLDMQPKLLRVLEDRRVIRVGGRIARNADVRIVAATNRDLAAEAARGAFRSDLYFRLSAFPLHVPPLRDRRLEIVALAQRLLAKAGADRSRSVPELSAEAQEALLSHTWPGNVRELGSVMMRALLLADPERAAFSATDITRAITPNTNAAVTNPSGDSDTERARIVHALEQHAGNQRAAAASLGIARRTLIYKLDKLGVPRPRKGRL